MMSELKEAQFNEQSRPNTALVPVQSVALPDNTAQLLTTGEAYQLLKTRGFSKSINTLRRNLADALQTGALPEVLKQYGLLADFGIRRNSNPKDNSVRWLYLNEGLE